MSLKERILAEMNPGEPYTVSELEKLLDEPRRTVDYNLNRLAESGEVLKKKHSERVATYRLPLESGK